MHNFFNLTLPVLRIVVKIEASGTKMHLCKSSRKQKQRKSSFNSLKVCFQGQGVMMIPQCTFFEAYVISDVKG